MCTCWLLISNGDMSVCLLVADQQWKHGCVLVCLLTSNGDRGVCFLVAEQQWGHGCVLVGC